MIVWLSVFLCSLSYLICLKLICKRSEQLWAASLSSVSSVPVPVGVSAVVPSPRESSVRAAAAALRVLLVTAHPDDECMFFSPSLLKLTESHAQVHLLCLTSGDYYQQGAQRKEELHDSCAILGIPSDRITIIDNKELPDDPNAEWSTALTSSLIIKHIKRHSINMVLTFDDGGVSGHANHIAIYKAISHLAFVGRIPEGCQVFSLHTISIFRKYLSILELPLSWFLPSSFCCIIGPKEYRRAKEAMLCHVSQLLWFRRLYILFSRYMFVNTFRALTVERKTVKIY